MNIELPHYFTILHCSLSWDFIILHTLVQFCTVHCHGILSYFTLWFNSALFIVMGFYHTSHFGSILHCSLSWNFIILHTLVQFCTVHCHGMLSYFTLWFNSALFIVMGFYHTSHFGSILYCLLPGTMAYI